MQVRLSVILLSLPVLRSLNSISSFDFNPLTCHTYNDSRSEDLRLVLMPTVNKARSLGLSLSSFLMVAMSLVFLMGSTLMVEPFLAWFGLGFGFIFALYSGP